MAWRRPRALMMILAAAVVFIGVFITILGSTAAEIHGERLTNKKKNLIASSAHVITAAANIKQQYHHHHHRGRAVIRSDYIRRRTNQQQKNKTRAVSKSEGNLIHTNYMSNKRKVPNGPDPIHNRKAGNSRQPPGQA